MRPVTCTTIDCPNRGIPVLVPNDGTPVLCGPCGQWIVHPTE